MSDTNTDTITLTEVEANIAAHKRQMEADATEKRLAEKDAEIAKLKEEKEALKRAHADGLAKQALDHVEQMGKRSNEPSHSGEDNVALNKAIAAAGGRAKWEMLPESVKAPALGVNDSAEVKDSEIKHFFGKGSSSIDAMSLSRCDPAKYRRLKKLAILRHIL
ncbi:MAG: hypothetical protein ABSC64_20135 [Candidatus Korobacteraceae bacterium]|jgi:ATP-dependent Clp protease ATP-binding subunit ClpA